MPGKYRIRPEVIDRARERTGCTSDEQLAARIGVTGGTIHRIRHGATPSFITAIRLLNEAGVPLTGIARTEDTAAA